MIRLRFAAAALALGLCAAPLAPAALAATASQMAPQDRALIDKAEAYLDGLTNAKGRFTQTDPRGNVTHGLYWMKRPGRIRFEYDAPTTMLVVADGHNVTVYDRRLRTYSAYPLGVTPLHIFLARNIRLDRGVAVDRVETTPGGFSLRAHASGHARDGSITLEFGDDPVRLKGWTVTDARGGRTSVALTSVEPAPGLANDLFVISEPPRR